jgi:glycosyltransferase involved in cell wall biosynthesis
MKIAIARGPGLFGGIFRRFRELCAYCEGRHEVLGILPFAEQDGEIQLPVRTLTFAYHNVSVHMLRAHTIDDVLRAFEPLTEKIAEALKRERPDKILAVDTDLKGVCVIAACKRAGLPVTTFVAGLASLVDAYSRKPSERFMPAVEQYCVEASDKLIFPSRASAEYCKERYPKMAPFTVIHNGIASTFLNAERAETESRRIGAVMRLEGIKNPELLGRIADGLRSHGHELELVTAVPKPWQLPTYLRRIPIVPPTSCNDDLARFYAGCKAIVSPSRFECSGNVPMEAIAVGTPPVITEQMGISELFHELGLSHLVVDVDDVDGTIDRLVTAEPIPVGIREHVRRTYSWPSRCERIIATL